jgi:hypothetical protein
VAMLFPWGHVPRALATLAVTDGWAAGNAESQQIPDARANSSPAFPEARSEAAANPLVEAIEQFQLGRQSEVAHPTLQVTPQSREPLGHRDASTAPGQLADAMLEALDVLVRHVERRSRAAEHEAGLQTDRDTAATVGLRIRRETCGREHGTVGRRGHNGNHFLVFRSL